MIFDEDHFYNCSRIGSKYCVQIAVNQMYKFHLMQLKLNQIFS